MEWPTFDPETYYAEQKKQYQQICRHAAAKQLLFRRHFGGTGWDDGPGWELGGDFDPRHGDLTRVIMTQKRILVQRISPFEPNAPGVIMEFPRTTEEIR